MTGRITKLIAGLYTVFNEEDSKYYDLKPLGVFRHKEITPKVGDIVEFNETSITKIHPRFNDLIRPVICNIDQAIVVTSLKQPELNLNLLDRFIVILEYNDIKPILVFSKWDLVNEEEKKSIETIIEYYKKIGYTTIITSTTNNLLNNIGDYLNHKVSVITGESGTGKSSLLNAISPELVLRTNKISLALNRGKHTTRHTELIRINEGWIADTPGFGNLDLQGLTAQDLSHSMVELFELSHKCKFNGCIHINEPKCMVKHAVECNEIMESRYKNYLLFQEEIKKQRKW